MIEPTSILMLFFTVAVMSFVFRENPVFRFAEHTFVGFAAAHSLLLALQFIRNNAWAPLVEKGSYGYVVAFVFGAIMLSRLSRQGRWISRWSIALIVGVAIGVGMRSVMVTDVVGNTRASMLPLNSFPNIVQVLCIVTVLYFFFMNKVGKVTETLQPVARLGRYLLMLGIGAFFGNVVMTRLMALSGRFLEVLRILGLVP